MAEVLGLPGKRKQLSSLASFLIGLLWRGRSGIVLRGDFIGCCLQRGSELLGRPQAQLTELRYQFCDAGSQPVPLSDLLPGLEDLLAEFGMARSLHVMAVLEDGII